MSQFFHIHPDNPQQRHVAHSAEIVREGGIIVYPTDSGYALGCHLEDKQAVTRIRRIRQLDERHHLTLVCSDLSQIATYARLDNSNYRLLKAHTPGAYTFILEATREVPRRLMHPKRKTIGLRVPGNRIAQALLKELGEPLMSTTLILPNDELPLTDPYEIRETLEHEVDLVINGGFCGFEPTTVVDLTGNTPQVIRQGAGDSAPFSF